MENSENSIERQIEIKAPVEKVWKALTDSQLFGPVSYTHLRAHETVLDLVCRLLLEKKTKNQNNISLKRVH